MKIIRKNEREELVKEIPFEIRYEAFFSEPYTTLELKFRRDPRFKIGDCLYLVRENETVWSGQVTQRSFEMNKLSGGEYSVIARSGCFVLSQTEARPAVYEKPSFGDIAAFYLSPHGIGFEESAALCQGEFAVKSGMSEWEVIERFCAEVAGTRPYADVSGRIRSGEKLSDNKIVFSDNILSVRSSQNGEAAVRTVHYKPDKISDYKFFVINDSEHAVCGCERYENLSNLPRWQGQSRLSQIIKNSLRRTEALIVTTDFLPAGCHVGDKAEVRGFIGEYRVESIKYHQKSGKSECVFTLFPENIW